MMGWSPPVGMSSGQVISTVSKGGLRACPAILELLDSVMLGHNDETGTSSMHADRLDASAVR